MISPDLSDEALEDFLQSWLVTEVGMTTNFVLPALLRTGIGSRFVASHPFDRFRALELASQPEVFKDIQERFESALKGWSEYLTPGVFIKDRLVHYNVLAFQLFLKDSEDTWPFLIGLKMSGLIDHWDQSFLGDQFVRFCLSEKFFLMAKYTADELEKLTPEGYAREIAGHLSHVEKLRTYLASVPMEPLLEGESIEYRYRVASQATGLSMAELLQAEIHLLMESSEQRGILIEARPRS